MTYCPVKAGNLCWLNTFSLWTFGLGRGDLFQNIHRADELYAYLEGMIKKGNHGKPYFRENLGIHFVISAIPGYMGHVPFLGLPCGLDIQEVRKVRSRKMLERVLSREEQELVQKAQTPEGGILQVLGQKRELFEIIR